MNAPTLDSSSDLHTNTKPTSKKRRNLPGMPDPEAEVIALSPKSLLATNRFLCEICNKGFQRDQNLQLHRRGHNLPWKLRQKSSKDVKKRVYVCPEPTCVHHDPTRALGDLTGIKKHFCRKHGEKKWKCEKCCKKYAVQSDWKAHSKVCGTKEYKCDCGTLFTRRDSFITHRAFCDALAEESVKAQLPGVVAPEDHPMEMVVAPTPPQAPAASPGVSNSPVETNPEFPESTSPNHTSTLVVEETAVVKSLSASCSSSSSSTSNGSSTSNAFASLFTSSTTSASFHTQTNGLNDLLRSLSRSDVAPDFPSSKQASPGLSTHQGSSTFASAGQELRQYAPPSPQPALSATALLQKAAQMGPTASNTSFLRGLGIMSSSSPPQEWNGGQIETNSVSSDLGFGSRGNESSSLQELMFGPTTSFFGPKRTTLDLLGLGMAANGGSPGGFSALMTSMTGGLDAAAVSPGFSSAKTWDGAHDFI